MPSWVNEASGADFMDFEAYSLISFNRTKGLLIDRAIIKPPSWVCSRLGETSEGPGLLIVGASYSIITGTFSFNHSGGLRETEDGGAIAVSNRYFSKIKVLWHTYEI
jgi:hypothetical protein